MASPAFHQGFHRQMRAPRKEIKCMWKCAHQQRGKASEGCCHWRLVKGEAGQAGLLCRCGGGSGLAKRRRRLGKKEGLSSFGQKPRGVTERGMKEVVAL
ncbi:hypothetical protein NC652_037463 [Populus alba x Populus x berolinensis]|nr:hypothetical protein NC652_037463 [Populus alba x Populus x berolinensis]